MIASKLILKCLEKENVEIIFGYPGGSLLPLYDAFRETKIKHVLVRNEQAAPHFASGYARESGKVGVCLATSGPGATNLLTGIATAYLDSIPIIAITGQVNTGLIGSDAFQEANITGAAEPFIKHTYLVKNAAEIPRIIKEAFYIATTGRPGPVLIDIPRDIQNTDVKNIQYVEKVNIPGFKPNLVGHAGQIKRAIREINESKRPVIYVGGGIILSGAQKELYQFSQKNKIPVITTLMGIGSFPQDNLLYCGVIGSHGFEYSKRILHAADLCICIGARMSDRGTTNTTDTISRMKLIHIDIDPAELGKNIYDTNIPIVGDAKLILSDLNEKDIDRDPDEWLECIESIKADHPLDYNHDLENGLINPKVLMKEMSKITSDDVTIVADVGLNQIWAALYFEYFKERRYFTSGGLGTMGYSMPGAGGAAFGAADKAKQIFAICGDGSFQMAMSELGVIAEHRLNVNILLINNHKLGMVRQLQHDNYGKTHYFGTDINFDVDFMKVAEAYNIKGYTAKSNKEAIAVIKDAISHQGPTLIVCHVHPDYIRF